MPGSEKSSQRARAKPCKKDSAFDVFVKGLAVIRLWGVVVIRVMDADTSALALDFRQCVLDIVNEGGHSLPVRILAP